MRISWTCGNHMAVMSRKVPQYCTKRSSDEEARQSRSVIVSECQRWKWSCSSASSCYSYRVSPLLLILVAWHTLLGKVEKMSWILPLKTADEAAGRGLAYDRYNTGLFDGSVGYCKIQWFIEESLGKIQNSCFLRHVVCFTCKAFDLVTYDKLHPHLDSQPI